MRKFVLLLLGTAFIFVCPYSALAENDKELLSSSDITWTPLNPARGDKSPQAGQLWGDRTTEGPSGFLVKFADGFSSPPHIHNVTYRGVVIEGLVHNDDPQAENMWLPAGSFWTQPAGEAHITSAQGERNIAYIEIEDGPYLVKPTADAFDNGERPVNVDPSNLVWLNAKDIKWVESSANAKVAFLWGKPNTNALNGSMIKLPAGFSGSIKNNSSEFRAVIVSGHIQYRDAYLNAGSYFGSSEPTAHIISTEKETVIYVRTSGPYQIK